MGNGTSEEFMGISGFLGNGLFLELEEGTLWFQNAGALFEQKKEIYPLQRAQGALSGKAFPRTAGNCCCPAAAAPKALAEVIFNSSAGLKLEQAANED